MNKEIINRLELVDSDVCEWEMYVDPDTGKYYTIDIEIVRNWDSIRES